MGATFSSLYQTEDNNPSKYYHAKQTTLAIKTYGYGLALKLETAGQSVAAVRYCGGFVLRMSGVAEYNLR